MATQTPLPALATFDALGYASDGLRNISWDALSANGAHVRCHVSARDSGVGWYWIIDVDTVDGSQLVARGDGAMVADAILACATAANAATVTLYEVQDGEGAPLGRFSTMGRARANASARTRLTGGRHHVRTIA